MQGMHVLCLKAEQSSKEKSGKIKIQNKIENKPSIID